MTSRADLKAPSTFKAQSKSPRRPLRRCVVSPRVQRPCPLRQGQQMTGSWPLRRYLSTCTTETDENILPCYFRKWRETLLGIGWSGLSSSLTDGWWVVLVVKLLAFLSIDQNKSQLGKNTAPDAAFAPRSEEKCLVPGSERRISETKTLKGA